MKDNQPSPHAQLKSLPWREIPAGCDMREKGHGRAERRTLKVTAVARGLAFPHAALAIQVLAATLSAHDSAWLGVHDPARLGEQLAWGQGPAGTDAWRVTAMLGPGEARDRDCRR